MDFIKYCVDPNIIEYKRTYTCEQYFNNGKIFQPHKEHILYKRVYMTFGGCCRRTLEVMEQRFIITKYILCITHKVGKKKLLF